MHILVYCIFSISVISPSDGYFGVMNENGTWNGLIKQVIDQVRFIIELQYGAASFVNH